MAAAAPAMAETAARRPDPASRPAPAPPMKIAPIQLSPPTARMAMASTMMTTVRTRAR